MYGEWISYWAKQSPANVAVILPRAAIGYATFEGHINKVAARLGALALPPGSRVAVHVADVYLHWLLVLALDRLGIASASLDTLASDDPVFAALKPDLVFSDVGSAAGTPARMVAISQEWFAEAMRLSPCVPLPRRPADEVVRIFASSGTTGTPKLMALTRAQVAARVDAQRLSFAAGAASRASVLIGPSTGGGFAYTLAFWSAGGSVVLNLKFARSPGDALLRTRPSHLFLATGTLLSLVRGPAAIARPLPSMEVHVVGSTLPRALAAEARRVLSPNLAVKYGATEAPGVAVGSGALLEQYEGTAGHVLPTAAAEAVDGEGRVLPPGTTGLLRVRSAGMVTQYLNEPTHGDSPLRDGWFYPGDIGSVSADGLLLVHGRASDLLNIGGEKFSPQAFEDMALGCAGIRDAAAFSVPDRFGVETPFIAVVRGADHKPGELMGKLKARWPTLRGVQVAFVRQIPRNGMGKIERQRLRQQAMAAMTQAAPN